MTKRKKAKAGETVTLKNKGAVVGRGGRGSNKKPIKFEALKPWEKSYKEEFAMVAFELALLGFGDARIAKSLCVPNSHIKKWCEAHENFRASLRSGKDIADGKVAHSLYQRAVGYSHEESKVHFDKAGNASVLDVMKYYPPDTAAAQFWLKLRQKELWKEENDLNLTLNDMIPWGKINSGVDE